MYMSGLSSFKDIWDPRKYDFLEWKDTIVKFFFDEIHSDFLLKLNEFYTLLQNKMINQKNDQLTSQEWVGFYNHMEDVLS